MRATTASLRSRAPTATPPTAIPPYVSDTSVLFGATTMLDPYVSRSAWALSVSEAVIAKSATTVPTPMSRPATRKADREVRRRRLAKAMPARFTAQSALSATVGSRRLARSAG